MRSGLRRALGAAAVCAAAGAAALASLWLAFPFPVGRLEARAASPVVYDRTGRTVLALASADGEWRVPVPLDRVSPWVVAATVSVEDRRFASHPGVDPLAAGRAALQDLGSGRVVSGASTITMQLCRMLDPRPRTLPAKAVEAFRALQLERLRTKDEILRDYLNLAPYGGNVRGIEAASRVWYGKAAADLSLPEAALLAGLPQSPTRYRPDRHPGAARARRSRVLDRMLADGVVDRTQRDEADAARLPVRRLGRAKATLSAEVGRHAAWWALARRPRGGRTTIDLRAQAALEAAVRDHAARLPEGTDVAAVVIDVEAASIRALVGSADPADPRDGQVNGALALRSPGSALKPFLYAAAFATGRLGPDSLVPDRPIERAGWRPRNFSREFDGEVTAAEALRRSLNVPALLVAERTGVARCAGVLRAAGVALPADAASRGGLALATGAIEVRLVDVANAFATLARGGVHRPARLFPDEPAPARRAIDARIAAAIDDVLSCRRRLPEGPAAGDPGAMPWFMWKTGTSSRRRDAWAVGHNGRFAVGVWVGRFSGRGDPAYVGAEAAEPLLALLFRHPRFRSGVEPGPPPRLAVRNPWFAEEERPRGVRIVTPEDGAELRAVRGVAVVRPAGEPEGEGTWFLDGVHLADATRLELPPGRHELRLADASGRASAVRITVRE